MTPLEQEVLDFLLDKLIRHGDVHAVTQAKVYRADLAAERGPIHALRAGLPHDGRQSPLGRTLDGLGGTEPTHDDGSKVDEHPEHGVRDATGNPDKPFKASRPVVRPLPK